MKQKHKWTLPPELYALFQYEISGQLSDGAWENAYPYNHWEFWCRYVEPVRGESECTAKFEQGDAWKRPSKLTGYNLVSELVTGDCDLSDRMRAYVVADSLNAPRAIVDHAEYILDTTWPKWLTLDKETTRWLKANPDFLPNLKQGIKEYTRDNCIKDLRRLKKEISKVIKIYNPDRKW